MGTATDIKDRISEAIMSGEDTYWLNRLDDSEREAFILWLSQLFAATCSITKGEIIAEFDEKFNLFLSESRDGVIKEYKSIVIEICSKIRKEMDSEISVLDDRVSSAERQIQTIMHSNTNQELLLNSLMSTTSLTNKNIGIIQDSVVAISKSLSSSQNPQPSQPPSFTAGLIKKIPLPAWGVIVISIFGAAEFLLTGNSSLLKIIGIGAGVAK